MSERVIDHCYQDPVDLIWINAANELGLKVVRSADAFAAYDGRGTLTICTAEHFDADDCLAQMIFHEICHWLVAGIHGRHLPDWGLNNVDDRDLVFEYAAIRTQAALSDQYGLRGLMAVTTDWRPYWDALSANPLAPGDDSAIPLAIEAYYLARRLPFHPVLDRALTATATVAAAVRPLADKNSLWNLTRPGHRLGSLLSIDEQQTCGSCAWAHDDGHRLFCRQHQDGSTSPSVEPDERACDRWEEVFDASHCGHCGACCREGFDVLTVRDDDPFRSRYPQLIQLRDDGQASVPRPDGRCVALIGTGDSAAPYRCQYYDSRPQDCQDFEVRGEACLVARRRVGLSR